MHDVFQCFESQVRSYSRAYPVTFDVARGSTLWDLEGTRYLDFLAGCGSLNYGHNHPILKKALLELIERDAVAQGLDMQTRAKQRFLEAMRDAILLPRGMDHVIQMTGPTGTNAVEAALKLARKVTGRTRVFSFTNGYHGVTAGALAMTGNRYNRAAAGMPLHGGTVVPYDGYLRNSFDTIAYIERLLEDASSGVELPAACIVEPIQGEGGLRAASVVWLQRLRELCNRFDILLIADEIQSGCGRAGTFFSFEAAGIEPDLITLSKSLSGYGLPLALVLIKREFDTWKPAEHNGTFRGNNHAFVTATAALEHFWSSSSFENEIRAKAEHLDIQLQRLLDKFPRNLTEIRGRGMMRGLVCASPGEAAAVTRHAFENGLIIERSGSNDEVIKFLMPLTIAVTELDSGITRLEEAMETVFSPAPRLRKSTRVQPAHS